MGGVCGCVGVGVCVCARVCVRMCVCVRVCAENDPAAAANGRRITGHWPKKRRETYMTGRSGQIRWQH